MRKKLSFLTLTLFLLFMGAGTSWANFWTNGQDRGTWTLTNFSDFGSRQNLINTLKNNNWSATGSNQNTWKLTDEEGTQVTYFEGAGHMKVSGTVRLTIKKDDVELQGNGLVLYQNASISIDCNQYYAVEVTAKASSGTIDCNWSNVRSTPESPQFTTTEKTQTVLFSGNEQGWVTMTNPTNKQLTITEIKMYPKPTLLWTKNGTQVTFDKMNLIDLDYTEPTLEMAQIPSNANVWLTIDEGEGSIVTFNNDAQPSYSNGTMTYDLMGLDVGFATITAHATWNGGSLEASYRLRVDVDEYLWEMEGYDKYKITGEGAILNPVVDAVPYITMTYGNTTNTSMVRNLDNNLVATIIDEWGWRHVRCYNGNNGGAFGLPWQGTFYKFEPQIDGDLTVWMRIYNQWQQAQAVIVDANNLGTAYKRFYSQGSNIAEYETVHLIGGHTYYLYGVVNEPSYLSSGIINGYGQWAAAELNAFKFAPKADLIYNHKGVVYKDGKFYDIDGTTVLYNEARQPIAGGQVEYALEFYPSTAEGPHASIDNSGKLTIDPNYGGAIAVKATVKNGGNVVNRDYYIVTVPYKTHDWWFTESVDPRELIETRPSQQKQDFCTWGITYKVLRPEKKLVTINGQSQELRMRKEVKDPVLCSSKGIKGNNAGYAIQTAGLLFDASAQRFGINTDMSYVGLKQTDANGNVITVNDANGIPIDQYIDDWNTNDGAIARDAKIKEYAYNKTTADTYGYPTTYITMATTSTLIIPNLLEGQHIRIYWARHNTNKGDKYTATGVTDLERKDITGSFYIGNGTGYTEFIAKGGNATFTLDDGHEVTCWTNIYRITVGEVGEFLETHLNTRLGNIAYNPQPSSPTKVTGSNGSVTYQDITPYQVQSGETMTIWGPMRNFNTPYETSVTDGDGTITYTLSGKENVGITSSLTRQYKIFKDLGKLAGTGEVTYDNDKTWTFKGNGIVAVVINGSSNGYVLDTDTLNMAYGTVHPQTYPYTWDFTRIGRNTSTKTMLSNAYQNGFGEAFNWIKKNYWGDPNTKTESNYKMWVPATDVEGEYILNGYEKELKTTFFAQGSELSANFVPIEETKGLGIYLRKGRSGSYFLYSMAKDFETDFTGHDMLRYGTVDEGTGAEDGSGYLRFPAASEENDQHYIIRVPNVSKSNNERVYICASGIPTVYQEQYANNGNGSDSDITTLAANSDGKNSYFVPKNNGDVFIDVSGLKVFKIGVTSTYKPLKTYGSKSYATESRDHNERYDLSGYFTGDEVLAYKATSFTQAEGREMIVDDDNDGVQTLSAGKLNLEPVDVAAQNTGVILIGQAKAEDGHFSELPLFVKDVNSNITSNEGNLLKPVFVNGNGDSNWGSGTNYILTRSYTNPSGQSVTGPLAFYKATNITPSMSKYKNLAFLDLTGLISEDGGNNGGSQNQTVEKIVTYALAAGNAFTSGQTVNVQNEGSTVATITYGESGGNDFKAAKTDASVSDFTAYTEGNGTDGDKTGGTFYTITPTKGGSIEVAVVLNANKAFYILEDGTALAGYDGMTVGSKYYGTYTFNVKAGKSYKIYCAGSKLGFYGFKYTYNVEVPANAANYDMFWFIDEEEEDNLDGIENISLEEILAGGVIETENAVYYNLNGQKLNGKPAQKGIYICNGKKIYVK